MKGLRYLLPFLICVFLSQTALADTDGPWNYLGVTGYSGFITMNVLTRSSMFYWLFEAIDGNITTDSRALIIWLEGGPGCSGSTSMIWQNISPLHLSSNGQPVRTSLNFTWATDYHIMSIDFPYGSGYSFANSPSDEKNTTSTATAYLLKFLNKLYAKYPAWFNRPVYLFGESYAGHWIPSLSTQILAQNAQSSSLFYNLQGIGIGSPWIDPFSQSMVYSLFSYSNGLIDGYQQSIVNLYQNLISNDIQEGNLAQANTDRSYLLSMISSFAGGANIFNFRRFTHYSYTSLTSYMNSASTKSTFHATTSIHWENCNNTVDELFASDHMNSTVNLLSSVLAQGIKVLIYHGQDDLINPITSMEPVFALLNWNGINAFNNAKKGNWYVNNTLVGYVQSAGNLTYASLFAAGHYADHDQPHNIKDMVLRFINGTSWY